MHKFRGIRGILRRIRRLTHAVVPANLADFVSLILQDQEFIVAVYLHVDVDDAIGPVKRFLQRAALSKRFAQNLRRAVELQQFLLRDGNRAVFLQAVFVGIIIIFVPAVPHVIVKIGGVHAEAAGIFVIGEILHAGNVQLICFSAAYVPDMGYAAAPAVIFLRTEIQRRRLTAKTDLRIGTPCLQRISRLHVHKPDVSADQPVFLPVVHQGKGLPCPVAVVIPIIEIIEILLPRKLRQLSPQRRLVLSPCAASRQ